MTELAWQPNNSKWEVLTPKSPNRCMSLSWVERKDLLGSLLQARGDDDEGIALDGVLHGQNTIGKTCKFFSPAVEI